MIPYIRLREFFEFRTERPEREQIMIAETEDGRYGFVVDEVLGDHKVRDESSGRFYRHVQFVSGATILGNGSVALILRPHPACSGSYSGNSRSLRARPASTQANAVARD